MEEKEIRERCEKLDKAKELIYEAIRNISDATAGTKQADTGLVIIQKLGSVANNSDSYAISTVTAKLCDEYNNQKGDSA